MAEISNSTNNTIISGTPNDDSIENSGDNVTINSYDGNDHIASGSFWKYPNNVVINAGAGDDSINNKGDGATISAGGGNDSIRNDGSYAIIDISSGNNYIYSEGRETKINTGDGYDTIHNYSGSKAKIDSGNGNDYIHNHTDNIEVTINAGDGDDYIQNNSRDATINAGSGDDTVLNNGRDVTINAGNGNDYIQSNGDFYKTVYNVSINAGDGNDTIYYSGENGTLDAGAGDDSVKVGSNKYTTVKPGSGNDTIELYAYVGYEDIILYESGNDVVKNYRTEDKIKLSSGNISKAELNGNDVVITVVGNGSITLKEAKDKQVTILDSNEKSIKFTNTYQGSSVNSHVINNTTDNTEVNGINEADTITNTGSNVKIYGKGGNDSIVSGQYNTSGIINNNVTIDSGTGDDTVNAYTSNIEIHSGDGSDYISTWYSADYVTIDSGKDNDVIENYAANVSINGGSGNDIIRNLTAQNAYTYAGTNVTINGGSGNDNIYLSSNAETIQHESGNDVIYNYGADDKIQLLSGKISKAELNGNDVVITIGNSSITLKEAKGKQVTVIEGNKSIYFTDNYDRDYLKKKQLTVIKDFMRSLDETNLSGIQAIDEAIKYSSDGKFESYEDLLRWFVYECQKAVDIDTFIKKYCGIDLDNNDTGAITGFDAGGSIIKTNESIVPENKSLIDLAKLYMNKSFHTLNDNTLNYDESSKILSFTKNGLTLRVPDYDEILKDNLKSSIVNGLYSWWLEESLKLIEESYNMSFKEEGTTVTEITLDLNPKENPPGLAQASPSTNDNGIVDEITLWINIERYNEISGSSNDKSLNNNYNGYHPILYLDRVISHELTHAVMEANVNNFNNDNYDKIAIIAEGMAELTHGADDTRFIEQMLNRFRKISINDAIKEIKDNFEYTSNKYPNDSPVYTAGYMLLRYFAKRASDNSILPDGLMYSGDKSVLYATYLFESDTLDVNDYDSEIKIIDPYSVSKFLTIKGNSDDNSIKSALNGSVIYGQKGDDTIYSSNGADAFYYDNGDGNDIIQNYTVGKDRIHIISGKVDSSSVNNLDVILKIGDGSITIKEGAGKKITVTENGTTTSKVYGEPVIAKGSSYNKTATTFTVNSKYESNEIKASDYASSVLQINASAYKKAINIAGNDNNNLIKGGKGADTLDGGLGDDTLTGGKGKNTFIYDGRGSDVITDYKVGDTIQTYADVTGSAIDKKNLTLTTADGGSLFIKNGKGKRITVNDLTLTYGNNAATMFANNNDTIDAKNYSMVSAVDGSKTKKSVNLIENDSGTLLKGGKAVDTLTSGTGNDTLTGNKGKDIFIYNSGDDIITDYTAGQDVIMIASDTTITASALKGKDVILTVGNQTRDSIGSLTLKKGKGKSIKIVKSLDDTSLPVIYGNGNATVSIATSDGSIISDVSDNINSKNLVSAIDVSKSSKSKIIRYSDTKSIRISGGKKADPISGNSGNDTIYGNAGNDSIVGYYIVGYYGDDILNGGAGNDTIIGYNGNNTLTGGKGKDTFVYGGNSNDTITDYTAGQDKVYLSNGVKFKSATYDGKNLIFTTSNDKTLTLQNTINRKNVKQKVTIVDNGIATSQVYGESSITIANADCATINATTSINSGLTSIYASKRSKAIYIVGNNNNSIIKGSKSNDTVIAGSGANIIDSGKGNDSFKLAQNHQKSTIVYTGGNDTVTNFDLSDTISLKSGIIATASKVSNTECVLTLKKGKIKLGTLDVSGNSAFSVDSDNNVSIGGISAKISTTSTITKAAYTEQLDMETSQLKFFQDNLLEESSDLDSILLSSNHSVFSQIPYEFCFSLNTDTLSSLSFSQPDSNK